MGLRDQLHTAEEKTARSLRRGIDRAREEWADAERRIRQKMRIYPDKSAASSAGKKHDQSVVPPPCGGHAGEQLRDPEAPAARKTIISIHGRDLNEESQAEDDECGHLMQPR